MSNLATITVADAAATPVNHDFVVVSNDGGTTKWEERSASHPSGYWKLAITFRNPVSNSGSRVYRANMNLDIPILVTETVNGVAVPKVAYVMRFFGEVLLPESSTLQNRKDHNKILTGVLGSTQFQGILNDLIHRY